MNFRKFRVIRWVKVGNLEIKLLKFHKFRLF